MTKKSTEALVAEALNAALPAMMAQISASLSGQQAATAMIAATPIADINKPAVPFSTNEPFKNNAMIQLHNGDSVKQVRLSFGRTKAKLIVALYAEIKAFAEGK